MGSGLKARMVRMVDNTMKPQGFYSGISLNDATARREVMLLCAMADSEQLDSVLNALSPLPQIDDLRRPETGLVMMQGRMGGDGAAFNLGEATVSRSAVRFESVAGTVTGFAWHLGRDGAKARKAAVIDALWQDERRRSEVADQLTTLRAELAEQDARKARQTAATRVDFFTMVRGED